MGWRGMVVRSEVASYGERPLSGPRAIAGVVEVLGMLGVSRQRIRGTACGKSRTESGMAARLSSYVRGGGDRVAVAGRGPLAGLTAGGRSGG
jgi:hypothetical protein